MIKRNEIESPESCLNKAQDNERLFVLLSRDPAAPVAIRAWIAERIRLTKNKPGDEQIREAYECASLMEFERPEIEASVRSVLAGVAGRYDLRGLPPSISTGERYIVLKTFAKSLRSQGASHADLEVALLVANASRCLTPMAEDAVKAIAQWAAKQPPASNNGRERPTYSAAATETSIKFSTFARMNSLPTPQEGSWEDLVALFSVAKRTMCSTANCPGSSCPHKGEGELWAPAVFKSSSKSNTREAYAVTGLSLLVFDVDGSEEAGVDAMRAVLSSYQHMIHATHGDHPGLRRLRVIIQLTRAVTPEEWDQFWLAANLVLQTPGDPACRDMSRRYYIPSRPHDADYFFASCPGIPFDVDAVLSGIAKKMIEVPIRVLGQEIIRLCEQVEALTRENEALRREGGML